MADVAANYDWHRAEGKALETILAFIERRKAAIAARAEWLKQFGSPSKFCVEGEFLRGIVLPDPLPPGWRRAATFPREVAVPDRRTEEGRRIAKEMAKVRVPGAFAVTDALGLAPVFGDGYMRACAVECHGTTWVVGLPVGWLAPGDQHRPVEGLVPIKRSEYWALKEAAEATKAKADLAEAASEAA